PTTADTSPLSLHDALPILKHFLPIAAAVGEGHIMQLNIAVIERRVLLRLGQLGQIQQFPGVLHGKLHALYGIDESGGAHERHRLDRKSTRLNSSHVSISYA